MSIRNRESFRSVHSRVCYLLYTQQAQLLTVVSKTEFAAFWSVFS